MSRVTPKTNWASGNVPKGPDLNRIEGNAQQAFDEIDLNEANRAFDEAALQANIDSVSADLGGLDFVNGNDGTYGTVSISAGGAWVIPKGSYIFTADTFAEESKLQVYTGSSWVGNSYSIAGFFISDGINYRIYSMFGATIYYKKLS